MKIFILLYIPDVLILLLSWNAPFIPTIFFCFKVYLAAICIVTLTFWLLFAWYIFVHLFALNLFLSLNLKCVSYRKHNGSCFFLKKKNPVQQCLPLKSIHILCNYWHVCHFLFFFCLMSSFLPPSVLNKYFLLYYFDSFVDFLTMFSIIFSVARIIMCILTSYMSG